MGTVKMINYGMLKQIHDDIMLGEGKSDLNIKELFADVASGSENAAIYLDMLLEHLVDFKIEEFIREDHTVH